MVPTYDYECANCGFTLEIFQQISEKVKRKCPNCKRMKLRRLIGPGSGVIFKKGFGGFYSQDYGGRNASDGGS